MIPGTEAEQAFLTALVEHGLFIPTGAPGVFGRGYAFEDVLARFDAIVVAAAAPDKAERMSFPPVMSRETMERSGYLKSFPHLAATLFSFDGTEGEALELYERSSQHEDWSSLQAMTDLVLVPATCYPVYPALAAGGPFPRGGRTIDAGVAYAFRQEPSGNPARLRVFRIHEMIRLGDSEDVFAWREAWAERAVRIFESVSLPCEVDTASDPFFGRAGRMLAANQREQRLKLEVLVPIASPEKTAVASFNYHQDHFGVTFGLQLADGRTAHSACLGFGLERISLALFRTHGLDTRDWPAEVRRVMWPEAAA